jgi:hypothetical protein
MASFLYCFPYSYYHISIFIRERTIVGRAITLERKPSKKKQRTDTKMDAKRINNDNFTRSNREKSNIAIAILEELMIGWHNNYFVFCW